MLKTTCVSEMSAYTLRILSAGKTGSASSSATCVLRTLRKIYRKFLHQTTATTTTSSLVSEQLQHFFTKDSLFLKC